MLVAELARGKRLAGLRQMLELAGDPDPLGGRPTGQLALRPQPGHQVDRPVGGILARLIEATQAFGEDRLHPIFQGAGFDQALAQPGAVHPP